MDSIKTLKKERNIFDNIHRYGIFQIIVNLIFLSMSASLFLVFDYRDLGVGLVILASILNMLIWQFYAIKFKKERDTIDEFYNHYQLFKHQNNEIKENKR